MAEQALDVRSAMTVLRRYRLAVIAAVLVGAVLGGVVAYLRPPQFTSVSVVLLQQATNANGQPVVRDPLTEARIASSDVVLGPAGEQLDPPMTAAEVRDRIRVDASTNDVITIEASASSPGLAEEIAAAVAAAEIAYVEAGADEGGVASDEVLAERRRTLEQSLKSVNAEIAGARQRRDEAVVGSPQAKAEASALAELTAQQADLLLQVDELADQEREAASGAAAGSATQIQEASPASRPEVVVHYAIHIAVGAGLALLLMVIVMSVALRHDRRLRLRDEIADAVGSPVVASVRSREQRSVGGWTNLLQAYEPSTIDAWAMRLALRQHFPQLSEGKARGRSDEGSGRVPASVTVIALAGDARALAVAPQLASYAASSGLRTRLVAAQRHESAASLWAACHREPGQEEVRPGLLVATGAADAEDVDLLVAVVVIDRLKPEVMTTLAADVNLLSLSPGVATAEDLARVAVVVDDAGRRISGVVVANPDSLDPTSGRLLRADRSGRADLPTEVHPAPALRPVAPSSGQRTRSGQRRAKGRR